MKVYNDSKRIAILVDGGFYRKRAHRIFGNLDPKDRADELENYCRRHLTEKISGVNFHHDLYRIFYYDCPPSEKAVYNPISRSSIELSKSNQYRWTMSFFSEIKQKRKFALRLGELSEAELGYFLSPRKTKEIINGKLKPEEIQEDDLRLMIGQKGVDMRIGLDIASLAYKKQVDQIVLISGDSDFVPAAKLARREGIDFVLDPLGARIKENLIEHIDGLRTKESKYLLQVKKTCQGS